MSNERRYMTPALRAIRLDKRWSQDELAQRSGVSKSTIIRLEVRNGNANELTVAKLAAALGVDFAQVITQKASDAQ